MNTVNARNARWLMGLALSALSATALVACGGGSAGNGSGANGSGSGTMGTISGTAIKGPVSGATVTAYAVTNGAKGGQLGSAHTNGSGDFTMSVGAYSGPMMLEVHGGSYLDEATGSHMNMLNADQLTCVVPSITITAGSATTGIQITPLTSMAQTWAQNMAGGMTMSNITQANSHMGNDYLGTGVDIVMTHPIDPTVSGAANGASIDSKNYGMVLAAMSQEAHDLGMTTSSSSLITAMTDDASDGMMDGRMGTTAIGMSGRGGMMGGGNMMSTAGTSQLATAMGNFVGNPMNRSGVTSVAEMQTLMDQLHHMAATGGHL